MGGMFTTTSVRFSPQMVATGLLPSPFLLRAFRLQALSVTRLPATLGGTKAEGCTSGENALRPGPFTYLQLFVAAHAHQPGGLNRCQC